MNAMLKKMNIYWKREPRPLTLDTLFPNEVIICPRTSTTSFAQSSTPTEMADRRALGFLSIVGSLGMLLHQRYWNDYTKELLKNSGLPFPENIICYKDPLDFRRKVRKLSKDRSFSVSDYLDESELDSKAYSINRNLLSYIGDKANISNFVPHEYTPSYQIFSRKELESSSKSYYLPSFIKTAGNIPSSGGEGVAYLRDKNSVFEFLKKHPKISTFVIQEAICSEENLCVQYAIFNSKEIEYLGFSNQRISEDGKYLGGWVNLGSQLNKNVAKITKATAELIAKSEYQGVLGIDVVVSSASKRPYVLDINPRVNASTSTVVHSPHLSKELGYLCFELKSSFSYRNPTYLMSVLKDLQSKGFFVPIAIGLGDTIYKPTQITGFIAANSNAELIERFSYIEQSLK